MVDSSMEKNRFLLILIILCIVVVVSGCTEEGTSPNNKDHDIFLGSWSGPGIRYLEFSPDNTCIYTGMTYKWDIKDGTLSLSHCNGVQVTYTYMFSEGNTILTLTDISNDEISEYTRQ